MENSMDMPQKSMHRTTIHIPSIPLLGIFSEENKNTHLKRYAHPDPHCNFMYSSRGKEAACAN